MSKNHTRKELSRVSKNLEGWQFHNDFMGKTPKRIRPWQREGFSSKKEWSLMRKRINNLIWKNRKVA